MAVLDATVAGADSNSFVASVSEAEAYVTILRGIPALGMNFAGWDAIGSPDTAKSELLVFAAQGFQALNLRGDPMTGEQALAFPRVGLPRLSWDETVPDPVKMAQVADAVEKANAPVDSQIAIDRGITQETVAKRSVTYAASQARASIGEVSSAAQAVLRNAGLLNGRAASVYTPRG